MQKDVKITILLCNPGCSQAIKEYSNIKRAIEREIDSDNQSPNQMHFERCFRSAPNMESLLMSDLKHINSA